MLLLVVLTDTERRKDGVLYCSRYRFQGYARYATYRGILLVLPVPDTSVSSVRLLSLRYINTFTGHFDTFGTIWIPIFHTGTGDLCKFGNTSMPVPDNLLSLVQHQYRYRTLRYGRYINIDTGHIYSFVTASIRLLDTSVRYGINTCNGHLEKFGTTLISVPPVPVWTFVPGLVPVSVQHRYQYWILLGKFETFNPYGTLR